MDALAVEPGLVEIGCPVVRGEVLSRHLLGEVQHGVERRAGVVGEARPRGQRLDVEPVVEQEVQVPTRQQQ